ncbi:GNAT family N-acetyltransferase [Mesorhizobium sp. B2-3-3]|nr:GNAT family N-acetyltransferase [Mesorhizobium sp. B2-3-3]
MSSSALPACLPAQAAALSGCCGAGQTEQRLYRGDQSDPVPFRGADYLRKGQAMTKQPKPGETAQSGSLLSAFRQDGISLRRVGLSDRAAVERLLLDPEQEQFAGLVDVVFDELRNSPHPEFEHPFAIVAASETVGFFVLREKQAVPQWAPPGVVTLHSFRIGRTAQGRGYGRAGAGLAIAWVRRQRPGAGKLMLAVNVRNAVARSVYLRAGFADTGVIFGGPIGDQNILAARVSGEVIDGF